MRNRINWITATLLAIPLYAYCQSAGVPAGISATQPNATIAPKPATGRVRGQVTFASDLFLDKPDPSRAVIFFESAPALDALSTTLASATVAQKNKKFVPDFLAIAKGTPVEFPNWDHISHNVFSRSAAAPAFDLDRYPYGQSKRRVFDKVGIVQVFCNIHPWMRAIIFVTPNRFFARADAGGHFAIEQVPPGEYQLTIWQQRCAIQHKRIQIDSAGEVVADFKLSEDRDAIIANDTPRHDQSYGVDRGLGLKREHLNLPVVTESHPAPTTEPCPNCN